MSKADEFRASHKADIASGDIGKTTIERVKPETIAADLEEDARSIPICERNFVRTA